MPDFGSGLLQLPFAPNSVEMAAATQFTVQAALQKWLSAYIKVGSRSLASADECTADRQRHRLLRSDHVTQVQTYVYGGADDLRLLRRKAQSRSARQSA